MTDAAQDMGGAGDRQELWRDQGFGALFALPGAPLLWELELAGPGGVNRIGPAFFGGLTAALDQIDAAAAAGAGPRGLLLSSAHRDLCVGADLDFVAGLTDAAAVFAAAQALNAQLRRLETLGLPVVSLIDGAALGGGYELALATHRRVAVAGPKLQVGLPEVNLGVIPGGGGTQRLPRLIGLQGALEVIAQGQVLRGDKALSAGLIDALEPDRAAARAAALAYLRAPPAGAATQPWDRERARWPGPQPDSELFRNLVVGAAAMIYGKTWGAYAAPAAALAVVQEGARLPLVRGLEVEARAFARLVVSAQAKAMIGTLWHAKSAAEKHAGLPRLAPGEADGVQRIGVLGAGMMGAGLAFIAAKAGYDVILKDIDQAALDRGLAHVAAEAAALRRLSAAEQAAVVARVSGTLDDAALDGVDLVIEAVAERTRVKHAVLQAIEPRLAQNGLWASNTSALPITELAGPSVAPDRFLGLHFFSPVEKMPLVEVIRGASTSERSLARALSVCRRLGKTPILVNDGYGFYTTRVFAAYILEGLQLVAEGVDARLIEQAARAAGMVVPPLQVFDEVSLRLGRHVMEEAARYTGRSLPAAEALLVALTDGGPDRAPRAGRAEGAGFYTYADGRRQGIWPGLRPLAQTLGAGAPEPTLAAVSERLLLAQAVEAARAVDEGVVIRAQDADVGAILGLGFAPCTGGPLSLLDQDLAGAAAALSRLEAAHGPRFAPPAGLLRRAAAGQPYRDDLRR
jgi:3-hydroxyacyl-CoA dehydrogenase/enoyl-CoA hydratase/3-hydroxybutyryl-CoA epimerase